MAQKLVGSTLGHLLAYPHTLVKQSKKELDLPNDVVLRIQTFLAPDIELVFDSDFRFNYQFNEDVQDFDLACKYI